MEAYHLVLDVVLCVAGGVEADLGGGGLVSGEASCRAGDLGESLHDDGCVELLLLLMW